MGSIPTSAVSCPVQDTLLPEKVLVIRMTQEVVAQSRHDVNIPRQKILYLSTDKIHILQARHERLHEIVLYSLKCAGKYISAYFSNMVLPTNIEDSNQHFDPSLNTVHWRV